MNIADVLFRVCHFALCYRCGFIHIVTCSFSDCCEFYSVEYAFMRIYHSFFFFFLSCSWQEFEWFQDINYKKTALVSNLVIIFVLVNMMMSLGEELLHHLDMYSLFLIDSFNGFSKYCAFYTSTAGVRVCIVAYWPTLKIFYLFFLNQFQQLYRNMAV